MASDFLPSSQACNDKSSKPFTAKHILLSVYISPADTLVTAFRCNFYKATSIFFSPLRGTFAMLSQPDP
jgi:hypothetical protein